jgi:SAM-dependent methyltransferase
MLPIPSAVSKRAHWDEVYRSRAPDRVSWFRPHLERSLALLDAAGVRPSDRLVDVGGGASTLVDDLLDRGFSELTVLDLAPSALARSQARLGSRAGRVTWVEADVLTHPFEAASVEVWHDRAAFHFLTDEASRAAYLRQVREALAPGGVLVVASFALDGPDKCSGLPVRRHDEEGLEASFGEGFERVAAAREVHETPWGAEQAFAYVALRRRGPHSGG